MRNIVMTEIAYRKLLNVIPDNVIVEIKVSNNKIIINDVQS